MNPSLPTTPQPQIKQDSHANRFLEIVSVFLVIVAVFGLLAMLEYFNVIRLSYLAFLPHQQSARVSMQTQKTTVKEDRTCTGQLPKYQKISTTTFSSNGIAGGTLYGVLKQVNINGSTHLDAVELTPQDGSDTYTFSIDDQKIRIYDGTAKKYINSAAQLQTGSNVELTYNCDPAQGNIFTIVEIATQPQLN